MSRLLDMFFKRRKIIGLCLLSLVVGLLHHWWSTQREKPKDRKSGPQEEGNMTVSRGGPHRLVHLDLKGAAPKVKYLEQIFPLFASLGATGLLMEYEDMFPYAKPSILKSEFSYSLSDIKEIKRLAKLNNLELIPLVQTFGHLEFVLKHEIFHNLREMEDFPNSLNPNIAGSLAVVQEMINQVMKNHKGAKYFHIGCDEVYGLGTSKESKAWLKKNGGDVTKLYLTHVTAVAKYMTSQWPNMKLLMWDDMIRKTSPNIIKESDLPHLTTPIIWDYGIEVNFNSANEWISRYQEAGFKTVWFASAFKGATGPDQRWTPIKTHLLNHMSWLKLMNSMASNPSISLDGIILTGWQRAEHFSVLCELLPVGIPSLAVCLQTLKHGSYNEEAQAEVSRALGCNQSPDRDFCDDKGTFPGAGIYIMVHQIHTELIAAQERIKTNFHIKGSFSPYQRKYNFANPRNLGFIEPELTKVLNLWEDTARNLRSTMEAIYFPDTVEEWFEENVNPYLNLLRELSKDLHRVIERHGRPKSKTL